MTDRIAELLEALAGPWLYLLAFLMPFAETGTLLGVLVPGEVTLLVAGAVAGAGDVNLWVLVLLANVGSLLGDACGFWIGRRYGTRIKSSWPGRRIGEANWTRAETLVQRRKGTIILVGRWLGFLRAIMPATAGMTGMRYREFLPWDIAGCVSWATLCTVGGYLLGENWQELAHALGWVTWVLLAAVVAAVAVHKLRSRGTEPTPG